MKVLVIPDVHLKPWIFDRAEEIIRSGKAENAVCLMDIPDDWGMEFNTGLYENTYDRAIQFAKEHSKSLWCYGNHDLSYPWGRLETGYSPYAERTVLSKLEELESILLDAGRIAIMHRVDQVLFSHGGLSAEFVKSRFGPSMFDDVDEVIAAVNRSSPNVIWNDESPLWLRPQYNKRTPFRKETYVQVVGHTPVEKIRKKNGFISTDVFSTYRDGRQIGESAMIVIDTKTGKYEKLKVAAEDKQPNG